LAVKAARRCYVFGQAKALQVLEFLASFNIFTMRPSIYDFENTSWRKKNLDCSLSGLEVI